MKKRLNKKKNRFLSPDDARDLYRKDRRRDEILAGVGIAAIMIILMLCVVFSIQCHLHP